MTTYTVIDADETPNRVRLAYLLAVTPDPDEATIRLSREQSVDRFEMLAHGKVR